MEAKKLLEIKQLFIDDITLDAKTVMEEYIFWPRGDSEHYNISDIAGIKQWVATEINRVKAELTAKKAGTFIMEEAVAEVMDADGKVTTPAKEAVLYIYTTDLKLTNSIESELDVKAIYASIE